MMRGFVCAVAHLEFVCTCEGMARETMEDHDFQLISADSAIFGKMNAISERNRRDEIPGSQRSRIEKVAKHLHTAWTCRLSNDVLFFREIQIAKVIYKVSL